MVQLDIDIPENCVECPMHDGEYGRCNINKGIGVNFEERPRKCPIIEPEQRFRAKLLTEEYIKYYKKGYCDGFKIGRRDARPEIIQCKNCKHMGYCASLFHYDIRPYCYEYLKTVEKDDFCSRAERRTDEAD